MVQVLLFSKVFSCLLLQSLILGVLAGNNARIATFHIQKNEKAEQVVSMTLPETLETVQCTFVYDTTKHALPKPGEEQNEVVSAEDIIEQILQNYPSSKGCFEGINSGWTFKVCLGDTVVQSYSDPHDPLQFLLGKYAGVDNSDPSNVRLLFNGGDVCVPQGARTAHVSFTCGEEMKIIQVSEPSVCKYSITMTAKEVCGHPAFPTAVAEAQSQAGPEESWFLELTQLHDSTIVCTAQHSGIGKMDSAFYFNSFSLSFDSNDLTVNKARRANRAHLAVEEVKAIPGGFSSDTNFKNTLYYARITKQSQA
jgi:hypothetical protein